LAELALQSFPKERLNFFTFIDEPLGINPLP
jgi:hypothetical protein